MTEKSVPGGTHEFLWDGMDADGNTLERGAYDFTVTAARGDGPAQELPTFVSGVIEGVDFSGRDPMLSIGGVMYDAAGLIEVF